MKQEFEELVKQEVSEEKYNTIEMVYMYHPAVPDKKTIAKIYLMPFGYSIICDMLPRAEKIADLEMQLQALKNEVARVQELIALAK